MPAEGGRPGLWRKLARMSGPELLSRAAQVASQQADQILYRLGWKFAQPLPGGSVAPGRFFFETEELSSILLLLRQRLPEQVENIIARAERICQHRFDLLGYQGLSFGDTIDWHLDPVHGRHAPLKPFFKLHYLDFQEVGDAKVTWELNRHQHLVTLAKAYRFTSDRRFLDEIIHQCSDWRDKNPYPIGINWASSLEVAFRALSWLWVENLLAGDAHVPASFRDELRGMLALHGRHIRRYLSTYFSPNTHLLGEAVGLFFLGTLHPELRGAGDWRRTGWEIVLREAERQVRPDGMHFEQSTYYHLYALDFFLHTRILASRNDREIPATFDRAIEAMLSFLAGVSQAGNPPRFGDDDGGRLFDPERNRPEHLLDPLATGSMLFHRPNLKQRAATLREESIWLLGRSGVEQFDSLASEPAELASRAFEQSGIYALAHNGRTRQQATMNTGWPEIASAGHGHADNLSLTLAVNGKDLLLDPGTLEYIGAGAERERWRSTGAHSTLQVDGLSQSEPLGPFRWGSAPGTKVEQWIPGKRCALLGASHRGYTRLTDPIIHRRWVFQAADFLLVRDRAEGRGVHEFEINWRMAPGKVSAAAPVSILAADDSALSFLVAGSSWSQSVVEDWWSPAYGRKEPVSRLRLSCKAEAPVECATLLVVNPGEKQDLGSFDCFSRQSDAAVAYRWRTPQACHYFVFAGEAESWSAGPWSSDARFLYFGRNLQDDPAGSFVLVQGSYFREGDREIAAFGKRVESYEYLGGESAQSAPQQGSDQDRSLATWLAGLSPSQATAPAGENRS